MMASIPNILFASFKFGSRKIEFAMAIWLAFTIAAIFAVIFNNDLQNYLIYKGVFWHTVHQTNLYAEYPLAYKNVNHYGPFFSVIIAPFALLPDFLGIVLWCMLNSLLLLHAIKRLPISIKAKTIVLLVASMEMMASIHSQEINPMLTGWFIYGFLLIKKRNDFRAAFFFAAGFMVKLYGLAGLLFFVFSRNKKRFILSFAFWVMVMFLLPMIFSSPSFITHSYIDWLHALEIKNVQNMQSLTQDTSLIAFIRRTFQWDTLSNFAVIASSILCIILPLLRVSQYRHPIFRLSYLAIVLISVMMLSSSTESHTCVLAVTGCAIWYAIYPHTLFNSVLLIFLLLVTCMSSTDLFPDYLKEHFIKRYSLKALPCIVILIVLLKNVAFATFYPPKHGRE